MRYLFSKHNVQPRQTLTRRDAEIHLSADIYREPAWSPYRPDDVWVHLLRWGRPVADFNYLEYHEISELLRLLWAARRVIRPLCDEAYAEAERKIAEAKAAGVFDDLDDEDIPW
jgi:hypothetical protein